MARASRSLLHRLDDAVYTVEKAFVAVSMMAMVLMVFLDVVSRRLEAQESKIGGLVLALGRLVGLRASPERSAWVARWIAPGLGATLLFLLLWFALATMRRRRTSEAATTATLEAPLALLGTGALFGAGWLMLHRGSNEVYALLWSTLAAVALARRRGVALVIGAVAMGGGALLLYRLVPEGYSWAKEVSMILLVWTGLIGASMASHQGRHIDIDFGKKLFPVVLRKPLAVLAQLTTVAFCGLIVMLGAIYVFGAAGLYRLQGRFPHTGIPDWIVAFAIPWSFGMIGLRTLLTARRVLGGAIDAKSSCPDAVPAAIGHGAPAAPASDDGESQPS